MYIVFFSTSDVFETEDRFIKNNIEYTIVPTPVSDKPYCGVCIETEYKNFEGIINDLEYNCVEKGE